jgi:hypothetical protein
VRSLKSAMPEVIETLEALVDCLTCEQSAMTLELH